MNDHISSIIHDSVSDETVKSIYEGLSSTGEELGQQIQTLIHEGNMRRLLVKDNDGRVVMEMPLTLGVAGALSFALFAPLKWKAIIILGTVLALRYVAIEPYEDQGIYFNAQK
ncbi:MAG: DUF4342 domain-containing protein [Chloroflexota bacterium]